MTNPIIAKLDELAPGYTLTEDQKAEIYERHEKGEAGRAAAVLGALIEDLRGDVIDGLPEELGVIKADILPRDVVQLMYFSFVTGAHSGSNPTRALNRMDRVTVMEIMARATVRQMGIHNPYFAAISARYFLVFGPDRHPDAEGLGFYAGTGLDPKEIEADMRKNKQQGAN